jgi:hypothetical protein
MAMVWSPPQMIWTIIWSVNAVTETGNASFCVLPWPSWPYFPRPQVNTCKHVTKAMTAKSRRKRANRILSSYWVSVQQQTALLRFSCPTSLFSSPHQCEWRSIQLLALVSSTLTCPSTVNAELWVSPHATWKIKTIWEMVIDPELQNVILNILHSKHSYSWVLTRWPNLSNILFTCNELHSCHRLTERDYLYYTQTPQSLNKNGCHTALCVPMP